MVPFAALLAALERIPDPRRPQGTRYPLAHLLLFAVLAVLAGATSYRGIVTFLAIHRDRPGRIYGVRLRRAPAVNTLRTICSWRSTRRRWRRPSDATPGTSVRPGRIRRAPRGARRQDAAAQLRPPAHDRAAAHVPGAFAADAALILGHQEVPDVPAEVEGVRAMIRDRGLTGVVLTGDALHCQTNLRLGHADRQRPARPPGQGQPAAPA